MVSIRKSNNFIYDGQVIVNTQNFHGFGRLFHYGGGTDMTNAYVYEGWFINGLPQGMGRKVLFEGTVYIGKFRFGLEHGDGIRHSKTSDEENEHESVELNERGLFHFGLFKRENN